MPITIKCRCGKKYVLDDKKAGKTLRCKECGAPINVPADDEDDYLNDDSDMRVLPVAPRVLPRESSTPLRPAAPRGPRSTSSNPVLWIIGGVAAFFLLIIMSCGGCILYVGYNVNRAREQAEKNMGADLKNAIEEAEREAERNKRDAQRQGGGPPVSPFDSDFSDPDDE